MKKEYTEINSKAMDKWSEAGWEWSIPISHEEYSKAKNGHWSVLLTPQNLFFLSGLLLLSKIIDWTMLHCSGLQVVVDNKCQYLQLWEQIVQFLIILTDNLKMNVL